MPPAFFDADLTAAILREVPDGAQWKMLAPDHKD